jgi:hypothetical protein
VALQHFFNSGVVTRSRRIDPSGRRIGVLDFRLFVGQQRRHVGQRHLEARVELLRRRLEASPEVGDPDPCPERRSKTR